MLNRINIIKDNRRTVIVSVISALTVLILCYIIDNLPYSFVGDATLGQRIEQVKSFLGLSEDKIPDDVIIINVAYDRQLVNVNDEFGLPKGNIDITDRHKLYTLLRKAKDAQYKYIMLDVTFSDGYDTKYDSLLFDEILRTNDIVIAKSENFIIKDSSLLSKARFSDYSTHISESNFVKYDYIRNGEPTFPYQVYLDIHKKAISKFGPFYFFNGKLARKSVVLKLPIKIWNEYEDDLNGNYKAMGLWYYNLGSDLLDTEINLTKLFENKIILIGDVSENDMHDTYLGKIAGPIINLNAYYALVNDDLSISYTELVFLFLLYFGVSFYILKRYSILTVIPYFRKFKSKTFRFFLSFFSLSFIFATISILGYLSFGIELNILIPSLYFTMFGYIVKYYYIRTEK